jgi:hypothetical protein
MIISSADGEFDTSTFKAEVKPKRKYNKKPKAQPTNASQVSTSSTTQATQKTAKRAYNKKPKNEPVAVAMSLNLMPQQPDHSEQVAEIKLLLKLVMEKLNEIL